MIIIRICINSISINTIDRYDRKEISCVNKIKCENDSYRAMDVCRARFYDRSVWSLFPETGRALQSSRGPRTLVAAPHPFEARFLLEVIFRVATELWPSGRRAKLERGGVRSFLEERSGYRFECGATFAPPSLPPRLYTFLFFSNPSRCETRTEYPIRNGARFLEIMILELFQWPLHPTYSLLTCRGLRATFFFVKYLNWRGAYRVNKPGLDLITGYLDSKHWLEESFLFKLLNYFGNFWRYDCGMNFILWNFISIYFLEAR